MKKETNLDCIKLLEKLQSLRKENPNNFTLGSKVRDFLISVENEVSYKEKKVSL